jgi:hypothetical protein
VPVPCFSNTDNDRLFRGRLVRYMEPWDNAAGRSSPIGESAQEFSGNYCSHSLISFV